MQVAVQGKQLADTVWCPNCRETRGEVWEVVVREQDGTHYEHITKPSPLPKQCEYCGQVLERNIGARRGR